ncbi:calcium-binding protein [Bauldia sp.]|uniref:calcium-binding protein n=1 Tax=Bauldia sp. TaxID=2575872 RepID=UPI003BAD42E1
MTFVWKADYQTNPTYGADQNSPTVTTLDGGGFVIAWTESDGGPVALSDGRDIVGQIYDALGNRVGGEFQLNPTFTAGDQEAQRLAPGPDGGFAVVYEDDTDKVGDIEAIRIEVFDGDGALLNGAIVTDATGGAPETPDIASSENGFLVTYSRSTPGDEPVLGVFVDAAGVVGSEFEIAGDGNNAVVTALADGSFAVVYEIDEEGGTVNKDIVARLVTSGDPPTVGPEILVDDSAGNGRVPEVVALSGGGFAVVYRDTDRTISVAVVDDTGVVIKSGVRVSPPGDVDHDDPSIAALPDGGFLVTWDDDDVEDTYAQRFDSEGNKVGDVFLALGFGETTNTFSALLEDGRVLVGHEEPFGTDDVFAAILDFREGDVIKGTNGKDVLTSKVTGAVVKGKDGKDILIGVEAQDQLIGGKGKDILIGDRGNDILEGGKNADQFVFSAALSKNTNVDQIVDFNRKKGDTIVLLDDVFDAVGKKVNKSEFVVGKKAKDGNDHLILKGTELYYDADGKGGDKQVLFATLDTKVKHKDFAVIDELVI